MARVWREHREIFGGCAGAAAGGGEEALLAKWAPLVNHAMANRNRLGAGGCGLWGITPSWAGRRPSSSPALLLPRLRANDPQARGSAWDTVPAATVHASQMKGNI